MPPMDHRRSAAGAGHRVARSSSACLAIAAFFLIMEYRARGLGVLPYVLFLLGPVLHLLRHGWHGRGHANQRRN